MLGTFGLIGLAAAQQASEGISTGMAPSGSGAARAESRARDAERKVKVLEANLAKTLMICEALWELLSEQTHLKLEHLHQKLYEIDMRDGVLDGKNQRKAAQCPNCDHMVSGRHPACIYCGQVMDDSVFGMS